MTERCQTKFTQKIGNQNNILSVGFIVGTVAAVYFYRFHFVTVAFSYALGCVACYYLLNSRILHDYLEQLKCHFVGNTTDEVCKDVPVKGCETCGSKECNRHDAAVTTEPWVGLQVHKQLDQAIEDFYNTILDQFITSWYSKVTYQPFFIDEIRHQLRYASACLLQRAIKINYSRFITERVIPCVLRHYTICADVADGAPLLDSRLAVHPAAANRNAELKYLRSITNAVMPYLLRNNELQNSCVCVCAPLLDSRLAVHPAAANRNAELKYLRSITNAVMPYLLRNNELQNSCACVCGAPLLDSRLAVHPAAANRNAELKYLRSITNVVMPYLLRNNELQNSIFRVLIREIFSGWVLLPLCDVLAEPAILNSLIVLATGEPAALPAAPDYNVEFLETFVRQTESVYASRCRLLQVHLELVVADQEHLYAFMQFMKTTSHLHLLQFYKDIKSFQTKILNPELEPNELAYLHGEACDMYARYFEVDGTVPASLQPFAEELKALVGAEPSSVTRLQTSRALYQAARQSHAELEKVMLPKFLHSEEFYKIFIGPRIPVGYNKQMTRKPQEKLITSALKLGNRIKGALKSQTIDGQVLDCFANTDISDGDNIDNVDILKYLDSVIADDTVREQDLSTYKVVLTNVETRLQPPPRRSTVRVFTCAVHRAEPGAGARLWTLERSENDFHLLRSKLIEFHGEQLLMHLPLPSRRDNSPHETLRYKYEDFLQRLLQESLLQTSELLHLFLTVDGDFSMVVQATTLNANNSDLGNIYQSVAHKLRKEKGQHLESFLRNLLVSSDIDRFQALKQGSTHVEEAQEMSEEIEIERAQDQTRHLGSKRDIHNTIFNNNFGVEPTVCYGEADYKVAGFTQCLMFILTKVIQAPRILLGAVGTILVTARALTDQAATVLLDRKLRQLVCERRLAHLITLGHGLLFGKKHTSRTDPDSQRELARTCLLESIPSGAALILGPGLRAAVLKAFEIIQRPQLNKQLVYNLLDLCLLELFPELSATDNRTKEPKS